MKKKDYKDNVIEPRDFESKKRERKLRNKNREK